VVPVFVAYVNAGSRVRSTALSGLTPVRISGRALYARFATAQRGKSNGENNVVASTKRLLTYSQKTRIWEDNPDSSNNMNGYHSIC